VNSELVVYVVEDDVSVRRAVTRLLRAHGWRTVAFASADAFLQAGPWEPVACLLLDLQMPGMTGWELLAELGKTNRSLPVIIITAHNEEPTPEQVQQAEIVAYLRKPFDEQVLLAALQQVCGPRPPAPP
jgi:FixJ family two-component response regulator